MWTRRSALLESIGCHGGNTRDLQEVLLRRSVRRLLVYFRIMICVAFFIVWWLAPSGSVENRRLDGGSGAQDSEDVSLHRVAFHVQAWHITLLILGFFSLLVLGAFCFKSPTQPPKYDQIFLSGFNLTDISTDIFVAVQSFQVKAWLGWSSTAHLASVFFVNLYFLSGFLDSLKRKAPAYWNEKVKKGSNFGFRFILLISAFGPSFMKILTSKMFGSPIFSLESEEYIKEFAALNWGICYEGFVQMGFAFVQLYLGWKELSGMKKLNVFLSLGTSMVMLLLALLEALFVSDAPYNQLDQVERQMDGLLVTEVTNDDSEDDFEPCIDHEDDARLKSLDDLADVTKLARKLKGKALSTFTCNFDGCKFLNNIDALTRALQAQPLKSLEMQFRHTAMANIDELGRVLRGMPLKELSLKFQGCGKLANIDELGRSLSGMPLTSLELDFMETDVANVDELGRSLKGMKLDKLELDFRACENLTNVEELGRSLSSMTNIPEFHVDIAYTAVPEHLKEDFDTHKAFKKAFG